MAGSEAPLEQRVYGIMQFLLAHYANRRTPESPAPRGIVAEQDALDAVLQVAAVIDEYTQVWSDPGPAGSACRSDAEGGMRLRAAAAARDQQGRRGPAHGRPPGVGPRPPRCAQRRTLLRLRQLSDRGRDPGE